MDFDTSMYMRAADVPQFDPIKAMGENINLKMLMQKQAYQQQQIQQELANQRATEQATIEGTRKSVQEREEKQRKIDTSILAGALYKKHSDAGTPEPELDSAVYTDLLHAGVHPEMVKELREKAQAVRDADLKDTTARESKREQLFKQFDAEAAKANNVDEIKGLFGSKSKELARLGYKPDEIAKMLSERYGQDPNQIATQARARLNAELTPKVQADLEIARGQLALAQSQEQRAQRGEARGVATTVAGIGSSIADIENALKGLDKLHSTYGTRIGTVISKKWDELVSEPGELGQIARAAKAYETRTGQTLDIGAMGYAGVRAALEGEKGFYEGQRTAQQQSAPPAPTAPLTPLKPGKTAKAPMPAAKPKTVRMYNLKGQAYDVPADKVSDALRRGLKK